MKPKIKTWSEISIFYLILRALVILIGGLSVKTNTYRRTLLRENNWHKEGSNQQSLNQSPSVLPAFLIRLTQVIGFNLYLYVHRI